MSRVFKFGGASVKNAESIINMSGIIQSEIRKNEQLIIVVSAMGKTTNALENLLNKAWNNQDFRQDLALIKDFHFEIINELNLRQDPSFSNDIENIFDKMQETLSDIVKNNQISHAEAYDRIVPFGELFSTTIISKYLEQSGIANKWIDARNYIKTSNEFREGIIDWNITQSKISVLSEIDKLIITQGFIGSDSLSRTTTLGREGSDFSAAIFASCLNSESVTIWKDVPGILNADPKLFPETELFSRLSYTEASEMTYYGASVIHPKTIKPLANKNIELNVRSFVNPNGSGTIIGKESSQKVLPVFILKRNQVLISFEVKDLTFINEKQIGQIFHALNSCLIKINVMQNSAVSLTIAIDNRKDKLDQLIKLLNNDFNINILEELSLITIINHKPESIEAIEKKYQIMLEQRSRNTCQYLISGTILEDVRD